MPKSIINVLNAAAFAHKRVESRIQQKVRVFPDNTVSTSEGIVKDVDFSKIIDVQLLTDYYFEIAGTVQIKINGNQTDITLPVTDLTYTNFVSDKILNFGAFRLYAGTQTNNVPDVATYVFRYNGTSGKFEQLYFDELPDSKWTPIDDNSTMKITKIRNEPVICDISKLDTAFKFDPTPKETDVSEEFILQALIKKNPDYKWNPEFVGVDYQNTITTGTDANKTKTGVCDVTIFGDEFYNTGKATFSFAFIPTPSKYNQDKIPAEAFVATNDNFMIPLSDLTLDNEPVSSDELVNPIDKDNNGKEDK